ncbi:L,D-transpeptidase family protein [Caloranaerobacter azorensis]|uniref:L,D-transpeptidase family protein n=1 Tax=Caloranaerobacter azorensis TaxID=116090 RepID=UPI0006910E47|nr:L,D-transpeptidase family protein [Caloranaerobacter azorensis]
MRKRLAVILTLLIFLLTGCKESVLDQSDIIKTSKADEFEKKGNIEKGKEQSDEKEAIEEKAKIFIGQALDTIDRDGFIEVYKEKNKKSSIIYKLKDYQQVKLLETLPYGWFKVMLEDGREGYVDSRYIRVKEIPPHEFNAEVAGYVLVFNTDEQVLKIYKDGELIKESIASSGTWEHFTPKGIFKIEEGRRGKWFYTPRFKQGGKYWVGFKGTYLFHSVPFTEDGKIIEEEKEKLGTPASHGCIRLPVDVAKYIYENIPAGSLVLIY